MELENFVPPQNNEIFFVKCQSRLKLLLLINHSCYAIVEQTIHYIYVSSAIHIAILNVVSISMRLDRNKLFTNRVEKKKIDNFYYAKDPKL